MRKFRYKAKDSRKEMVTGILEADTEQEALAKLSQMGYFPLSIERDEASAEEQSVPQSLGFFTKVRRRDITIFTRQLANTLGSKTGFPASEATSGQLLQPAAVWVAPGNFHMALIQKVNGIRIEINQEPPVHSCRPSVDVLFRSVARIYGPRALAVVLTGMGRDGLDGCAAIRKAGGRVLVQDQMSSVVWGMPGHVANAGLANQVLPLNQIADELTGAVSVGRTPSELVPSRSLTDRR